MIGDELELIKFNNKRRYFVAPYNNMVDIYCPKVRRWQLLQIFCYEIILQKHCPVSSICNVFGIQVAKPYPKRTLVQINTEWVIKSMDVNIK